jgi:hypothetical protein
MASAGSWLKQQGRFELIAKGIDSLTEDIANAAPY